LEDKEAKVIIDFIIEFIILKIVEVKLFYPRKTLGLRLGLFK